MAQELGNISTWILDPGINDVSPQRFDGLHCVSGDAHHLAQGIVKLTLRVDVTGDNEDVDMAAV